MNTTNETPTINMLLITITITSILLIPVIGQAQDAKATESRVIWSNSRDTTDQTEVRGELPLAQKRAGMRSPKFETAHLSIGFGYLRSDFSELRRLNIHKTVIPLNFSAYVNIPFSRVPPVFYISSGIEGGGLFTFRTTALYHSRYHVIAGLGAARSWYSYSGHDLIVNASKTYMLLAAGFSIVPRRVNLFVTVPATSVSMTRHFEGRDYTVKAGGIQFNFLVLLR